MFHAVLEGQGLIPLRKRPLESLGPAKIPFEFQLNHTIDPLYSLSLITGLLVHPVGDVGVLVKESHSVHCDVGCLVVQSPAVPLVHLSVVRVHASLLRVHPVPSHPVPSHPVPSYAHAHVHHVVHKTPHHLLFLFVLFDTEL